MDRAHDLPFLRDTWGVTRAGPLGIRGDETSTFEREVWTSSPPTFRDREAVTDRSCSISSSAGLAWGPSLWGW
jgi:hypothetical protein